MKTWVETSYLELAGVDISCMESRLGALMVTWRTGRLDVQQNRHSYEQEDSRCLEVFMGNKQGTNSVRVKV